MPYSSSMFVLNKHPVLFCILLHLAFLRKLEAMVRIGAQSETSVGSASTAGSFEPRPQTTVGGVKRKRLSSLEGAGSRQTAFQLVASPGMSGGDRSVPMQEARLSLMAQPQPRSCDCRTCKEKTTVEESRPYSGAGASDNCDRQCLPCGAIDIAMLRHSKKDPQIIKSFKKMDDAGKVTYMKNQKRLREAVQGHPSSTPYNFGDLRGEQIEKHAQEQITDILTDWIPFRRYFIEEKFWTQHLRRKTPSGTLMTF